MIFQLRCCTETLWTFTANIRPEASCKQVMWGEPPSLPLTLPFLPFPSLLSLSCPSLPLSVPSPPLPLEVGPLIQLGVWGSAVSSPSGSGQSPAAKRYLVHFGLKNASGESNFKCTFTKKYIHKFEILP